MLWPWTQSSGSNARAVVAYNRAERSRVEYERANGEYEFARDVMHTALGI
jgi:hypothetical protein